MSGAAVLSCSPPAGWHRRLIRRARSVEALHVASFALLESDGDFGAAATGRMGPDDAFAALIAYVPDEQLRPGAGLFGDRGFQPRLRAVQFSPARLQVTRPGQLGLQRFFTESGRPCCLYAVIRPVRRRPERLAAELSAVLRQVRFAR